MFTKSAIALAVIIGVTSGAATPSFAKQHQPRAHATSAQVQGQGYGANDYGAFALAPHSRMPAPNADERAPVPLPRALSGMESWDAYGQRWD
jgi:hypothetical protein